MEEIVRTNDAVLITAIEALLKSANIPCFVADQNMSVMEGSLGFLPRRILVAGDDKPRATQLLTEAGYGSNLKSD
jgi:hypothetical protein